jgi:hypothetical protein
VKTTYKKYLQTIPPAIFVEELGAYGGRMTACWGNCASQKKVLVVNTLPKNIFCTCRQQLKQQTDEITD